MTMTAAAAAVPRAADPAALAPVICVIDTLHRDLAVADDARRGRFTHAGTTLDLGRRPDWLGGGLPADEEWRIEWVKQYEGLALAHAYAATGDDDHLRVWEDLVESYLEQVPVGTDTSDVDARRVQNWIYAWQRFASVPRFRGLRRGLGRRIVVRLHADLAHIADHLTPARNHRTLELYALLIGAIALGDRGLAQLALDDLAANAATDIGDDGVQCERSSDYHLIVWRSLVGAIANGRAVDLPIPPGLVHRAHLAADVALHLQRPDGITPALSDGDQGDYAALLLDAAAVLARPDLRWAATGGAEGTAPAARHAAFPAGGYAVQRSGWGDRGRPYRHERWAVIDCGPLGEGGHGHYDHLSVEMMGGGLPLVVDPGRYTYADTQWRHWFKGTAAHNTVTVDGLDQQPYRRGKPKGDQSSATLLARRTVPAGATSNGVAHDAIVARATSPRYDAVHTRTLALVDDDYWVVIDRLDAPTAHDYVARWHLDAGATGRTVAHRTPQGTTVTFPGGVIVLPPGCTVTLERGWVAPTYGVRLPAPVVAVAAPRAAQATIAAVIAPVGRPDRVEVDAASTVAVRWGDHTDRVRTDGAVERSPHGDRP